MQGTNLAEWRAGWPVVLVGIAGGLASGIVVDLIDLCEKKRVKLRTLSDRVAEKIAKSQVRGPTPVSP